ncbi:DUF2357 domain-containing protein [Shewanella algae]|uniref:DUF2357 domain-containing protein n=1 Tax=Shewanella algae TaxID=38313 RepID=UPI003AB104C7
MNMLEFSLLTGTKVHDLLDREEAYITVNEYESVCYRLVVDEPLNPMILLGDYSLSLDSYCVREGLHVYESAQCQPFKNFVGFTQAEIVDGFDFNREVIATSCPINVFASKLSYQRALRFLRFIIKNEDISSVCFTVTKGGSDANSSTNNLSEKLIAGLRAVEYLNNEWGRFHHDPCVKKSTKSVIRPFSKSMPVDDRTISYLSSHPDSLSRSDPQTGDVLIRGQHYTIQQMVQNEIVQNHNVFENQVILYFLKTFHQFVIQLKAELSKSQTNKGIISVNGVDYISLDQVLRDSGIFITFQQEKIGVAYNSVRLALNRLQRDFKCVLDNSRNLMPIPTQQVLSKSHYMTLYRFMDEFYRIGEPSWRGTSELYGIRNISKLYEFVSLINIHKSLMAMGFSLDETRYVDFNGVEIDRPINEPCNVYVFKYANGVTAKLLYDLQTCRIDDLANPVVGRLYDLKHSQRPKTWRPDYQLRIIDEKGVQCHILDAKYSNRKTVAETHMPVCATKYGLETRMYQIVDGVPQLTVPDSVTLLYSGESADYSPMFRSGTAGGIRHLLETTKPQLGYIGLDETDIGPLLGTLKRLLWRTISTY